jgi:hypothetical protein
VVGRGILLNGESFAVLYSGVRGSRFLVLLFAVQAAPAHGRAESGAISLVVIFVSQALIYAVASGAFSALNFLIAVRQRQMYLVAAPRYSASKIK